MSKTSIKNKKAKAKKAKVESNGPTETILNIPNAGKCSACRYYPKHISGVAQPCKQLNAYVARKAEHPCWKAK